MINKLYEIFLRSEGVSIDTRENLTNKIFFALPGKRADSNTFYRTALDKGAIACVIYDKAIAEEEKCFYFNDTMVALQELAGRFRSEFNVPVIAVTGSNGKTTTKEILYSILKNVFRTHATSGNYNNHIGLPLTLLSTPLDTDIIILEMGANAPGDIKFLCEIGKPTHGLITSIGRAHLEGFGDLNGVISAKFELFDYLNEHAGIRFINEMDDNIRKNINKCETDIMVTEIGFTGRNADFGLIRTNPFVEFEIREETSRYSVQSRLTGTHNWRNIMNAIAVSMYFGVEPGYIKKGIENYIPQNSRSQWVKYFETLLLLDAYNANPSSVRAMFEDFDKLKTRRRKFVFLGEMAELGREKVAAHEEIVEMLNRSTSLTGFFLVGSIYKELKDASTLAIFDNVNELKENLPPGFYDEKNMIMVKGSRSVGLENLFNSGKFKPFNNFD